MTVPLPSPIACRASGGEPRSVERAALGPSSGSAKGPARLASRALFVCSTAWLVYLCSAMIRSGRLGEGRIVVFAKGDNPSLFAAATIAETAGVRCAIQRFRLLDKRLSEIVGLADLLVPGRLRRRIDDELAPLLRDLAEFDPDLVVVGNRYHAPERAVLRASLGAGRRVGLVEEGLSVYQSEPYWAKAYDLPARVLHRWMGVEDLYGHAVGQAFDLALLSDPVADLPFESSGRLGLGEFAADLRALAATNAKIPALARSLGPEDGLLLSQRLAEDGLCTLDEEIEALCRAVRSLPRTERIWFKAHPRDRFDKFSRLVTALPDRELARLDPGPYPIEVVLPLWRPRWILGLLSGTLVYARILYGLETFSAVSMLPQRAPLRRLEAALGRLRSPLRPVLL